MLGALERFPLVLLCGAVGSGCAIADLHFSGNGPIRAISERLGMAVALGLPLFFSLRLLRERTARLSRLPLELLGLGLLAGWYFTQPTEPWASPQIFFIRWLLLLAALHFFAAVSGYLRHGESLGFWQFNRRLFLRFCLTTLYSAVLTIGLELALLSANQLFDLRLEKAYGDLYFFMAGCFHPAFFLAGVPRDFAPLNFESAYPTGLKAFTQSALAPLVAVYTTILFAYAAKILVAHTWPRGWVALPVLLLSGVGIFAALLLYPLGARPEEKWARWYGRNFPRALAPLAFLLLLSLRVRINAYGFTEERYLGVVAGLWIVSWAAVFVVRPRAGIRWIPLSLALICLLSAFGPWSAGAVSKMSQLHRVTAILKTNGLWANGHAHAGGGSQELSAEQKLQFRSVLTYLLEMHGGESLRQIFASVLDTRKLDRWSAKTILDALQPHVISQHTPKPYPTPAVSHEVRLHRNSTAVPITDYRQLWQVSLYEGRLSAWAPHRFGEVNVGLDNGVLKFSFSDDPSPRPIPLPSAVLSAVVEAYDLPVDSMTAKFQHGARNYRLVFESISFVRSPDGPRFNNCTFLLFEK